MYESVRRLKIRIFKDTFLLLCNETSCRSFVCDIPVDCLRFWSSWTMVLECTIHTVYSNSV